MEGNLPTGSMMQGAPFGMLDLQNPIHVHHPQHQPPPFLHHHHQTPNNLQLQGSMVHQQVHGMFSQSANHMQELPIMGKTSCSDEDEPSFKYDDGLNGHDECGKWKRTKWTDQMVRLLITAVSYLGEEAASDCHAGGRRKYAILQKKGKWRSISKVLAERGCYVSPQQCEDKFNDLNKRYKRLTEILGRGTSCQIVENPALLDIMDYSDKAKEDARRILSSKQLFYEEMCSYHNGNRVNLPADPALQRSLQLALRSRDEHEEDDVDSDDVDDRVLSCFPKRSKRGVDPEESKGVEHVETCKVQLEEQRLHIQAEMLELRKQQFKWDRFSKKKDRELEKMKMENERRKLENRRLELELKRKELELNISSV